MTGPLGAGHREVHEIAGKVAALRRGTVADDSPLTVTSDASATPLPAVNASGFHLPVDTRVLVQSIGAVRGGQLAVVGVLDLDTWHQVGAAGEPAFKNSWVNAGAPYVVARYFRDAFGIVHLEGVVKSGTLAAVFTLPAGYRPLARKVGNLQAANGGGLRVDIDPSGDVDPVTLDGGATNTFATIDLTWMAEQ